jgi:hypothetical protein
MPDQQPIMMPDQQPIMMSVIVDGTNASAAHDDVAAQMADLGISAPKRTNINVVKQWESYIGRATLEDWQRLCHDVGLQGDFGSKIKCRKVSNIADRYSDRPNRGNIDCCSPTLQALNGVWVNIHDFLAAERKPEDVHHFNTRTELQEYSRAARKFYPKKKAKESGPLRALLIKMH